MAEFTAFPIPTKTFDPDQFAGSDGREVELQASATHLQWRYVGTATWTDLVALSEIGGGDVSPQDVAYALGFEQDAGNQSGSYQWDLAATPQLRLTLSGDLTLTATNITNGRAARLVVVQGGTGTHSLTLGSGFATAGGNQPAIDSGAGAVTAFQGFTSGGSVIIDLRGQIDNTPSVSVQTGSATNVSGGEATLNGELLSISNVASANVYFEWREVGTGTWNQTAAQSLAAAGAFSQFLSGLNEVQHEFRAVAEAGGAIDQGGVLTFTPTEVIGAVYTEDFENFVVGDTAPAGFSQPWGALTLQVVNLGAERALRARTTINSVRAALIHDAASSDPDRANASIFVQALTGAASGSSFAPIRALARVAGAGGSETGIAGGSSINSVIRIDEYINAALSTLQSGSFSHGNIRLNMLMTINGSTVTLKVWQAGTAEPSSPQLTATASITDPGGLGLFFFNSTDIDVTFLSIATGDAEPERP